jgi:hypothetical protein
MYYGLFIKIIIQVCQHFCTQDRLISTILADQILHYGDPAAGLDHASKMGAFDFIQAK